MKRIVMIAVFLITGFQAFAEDTCKNTQAGIPEIQNHIKRVVLYAGDPVMIVQEGDIIRNDYVWGYVKHYKGSILEMFLKNKTLHHEYVYRFIWKDMPCSCTMLYQWVTDQEPVLTIQTGVDGIKIYSSRTVLDKNQLVREVY